MKKAYIIHGWGGYPNECWFPWLKQKLEKQGFKVSVPKMPNTDEPKIEVWVPFLKNLVKTPDEETYLIGHSIGCQTILRYLESLPENTKINKAVLVAGFVHLTEKVTKNQEEKDIAKPWLETPINFKKINSHVNKITAIFSNNDPYVPLSDSKIFKEKLNAEIIVLNNKGHIGREDNVKELPEALNAILKN